jgi:hypothetical protein
MNTNLEATKSDFFNIFEQKQLELLEYINELDRIEKQIEKSKTDIFQELMISSQSVYPNIIFHDDYVSNFQKFFLANHEKNLFELKLRKFLELLNILSSLEVESIDKKIHILCEHQFKIVFSFSEYILVIEDILNFMDKQMLTRYEVEHNKFHKCVSKRIEVEKMVASDIYRDFRFY